MLKFLNEKPAGMKVLQRLHYNFPIKENDIVYTYLKEYVIRNGYLSFTKNRSGKTRFHKMKEKEIRDRKNM